MIKMLLIQSINLVTIIFKISIHFFKELVYNTNIDKVVKKGVWFQLTCVIAYKDNDKVYIGADSLSSSQQTMERIPRRDRKVFRLKDREDILIGFLRFL